MTLSAVARSKRNRSHIVYPAMDDRTLERLIFELKSGKASPESQRHAASVIHTILPKKVGRPEARVRDLRYIQLALLVEDRESDLFEAGESYSLQRALEITSEMEFSEGGSRDPATIERYYRRGCSELADLDQADLVQTNIRIREVGFDLALKELNTARGDHSLRVTARRHKRAERKRKKTTPI